METEPVEAGPEGIGLDSPGQRPGDKMQPPKNLRPNGL
jgi:hypothetical protein